MHETIELSPATKMKLNSLHPQIIHARETITAAHKALDKKKSQSNHYTL